MNERDEIILWVLIVLGLASTAVFLLPKAIEWGVTIGENIK